MPYDTYDAMMSGAPTDPQRQAALAQQLRQQALFGKLGMLTGDRVLGPGGTHLTSEADAQGKEIMSEREHEAQMREAIRQHQVEQQHQEAQLQQQREIADQSDKRAREIAALAWGTRKDIADEKAGKPGKEPIIPAKEVDKLQTLRDSVNNVGASKASFKDDYAGASHILTNTMAKYGVGTAGSKEAANWWQNYGRGFTLDEMHRLYGARLSPQEMAIFEQYHIAPGMDAGQIRTNLEQIHHFLYNKFNDDAADFPDSPTRINAMRSGIHAPVDPNNPQAQPNTASSKYLKAAGAPPVQAAPQMAVPRPPTTPNSMLPQSLGVQPQINPFANPGANLLNGSM